MVLLDRIYVEYVAQMRFLALEELWVKLIVFKSYYFWKIFVAVFQC